jgi:2-phospho-L-lactate/phosphoenolpyruvate guanylyltransferase
VLEQQRPFQIIVPFKYENAKSRLASVMSQDERRDFALSMLRDVLETVSLAYGTCTIMILARPGFSELKMGQKVSIEESDLDLNDALNSLIEAWHIKGWPADLWIIMADLALLTVDDMHGILKTEGDIVLSPGRGGGTNMILIRRPEFRTCYVGVSFPKHLDFCNKSGLSAGIYSSYQSGCDIDNPADLIEVLIHNQGESGAFLRNLGFVISEEGYERRVMKL